MPNFLGFPYVNPVSITSNQPAFISDTINLKRQSVKTGAQRWELTINFLAGIRSNIFGEFMAHYASLGEGTSFEIDMPQNPGVEDAFSMTNFPRTNGVASAGDTDIAVDGGIYTYPAGLFITFNQTGHDKVYMVTETLTNGSVLKITPPLVQDVPDNTQIFGEDVTIRVFHNSSNSLTTYSGNATQGVSWSFVEAL